MIDWQAPLAEPIADKITDALWNIAGWPNSQREKQLAQLILWEKPDLVVELGVYGGRSLIPQALALQYNRKGVIHGIDAWDADEVKKSAVPGDDWFPGQDQMDNARFQLECVLKGYGLESYVRLCKAKSTDATTLKDIDILNIDGGHAEGVALRDVEMWVPRVRNGGWIWFDDTQFPSVKKALRKLGKLAKLESDQGLYRLYQKK
jgi:hypothetical protein